MNPYQPSQHDGSEPPTSSDAWHPAWTLLGAAEVLLGSLVLWVEFTSGIRDQSSLGEVFFFWGSLIALGALVLPGLTLLFRVRWLLGCQLVPGLLLLLILFQLLRSL